MDRRIILAAVIGAMGVTGALASTVTVVGAGGGSIIYDGKPVGPVPLRLTQVPPGRHIVRVVTSAGERTFDLAYPAGQNVDRVIDMNVELARAPQAAPITQQLVPPTPMVPEDQLDYTTTYPPQEYYDNRYPYDGTPYNYYSYGYPYYDNNYWGYPYYSNAFLGRRHGDHDRDGRFRSGRGSAGVAGVSSAGIASPAFAPPTSSGFGSSRSFSRSSFSGGSLRPFATSVPGSVGFSGGFSRGFSPSRASSLSAPLGSVPRAAASTVAGASGFRSSRRR